MLKYTDGYVIIKGIKIHYYRTGGNKPPFILLHGATDNGLCWAPVAELLTDKYDVIMPDAQGHGLSDRFNEEFMPQRHTEQVAGLIKELGLIKPLIMGHSMGGSTAVNVAVKYPDLPAAIILEDPPWFGPDSPWFINNQDRKKGLDPPQGTVEELMTLCREMNPTWSEEEVKPWAQSKLEFDRALFSKPMNITHYEQLVPKIECPTLLIISDNGIVTTKIAAHAAELWRSGYPFTWVQIKGAGHNIRREQFTGFKQTLLKFLKL